MEKNNISYVSVSVLVIMLAISFGSITAIFQTESSQNTLHKSSTDSIVPNTLPTHDPVVITSNSGFITAGFYGAGTKNDPYIFQNYFVTTTNQSFRQLFSISGTTAYFVIRNCYFTAGSLWDGIRLNNVKNGIIEHNTFNLTLYQINVLDSSSSANITITNNVFTNAGYGAIQLQANSNVSITNNIINTKSSGFGISGGGDYLTVTNNSFTVNSAGTGAGFSGGHNYLTLTNNSFSGGSGLHFDVLHNSTISNNYIANSKTSGITFLYAYNSSVTDNIIFNSAKNGILLTYSSDCTFYGNTITNSTLTGFQIQATSNNITVDNNTILYNNYGFNLDPTNGASFNNTFQNNTISYNTNDGILVNKANNNTFSNNIFTHNTGYGLNILNSTNNTIFLNSFLQNNNQSIQGSDQNTTNYWTNGVFGNYWSDYTSIDSNGDGIGDSIYTLDGGASTNDTLPLMNPSYFRIVYNPTVSFNEASQNKIFTFDITGYGLVNYIIYQDSNQVASMIGMQTKWATSTVSYNASNMGLGIHNITIIVTNINIGVSFTYSNMVTVLDNTAPQLTTTSTSLSYAEGSTGNIIQIGVTEAHFSHYTVFQNSTQLGTWYWSTGSNITFSVDGLSVGTYNYTIVVFDSSNNQAETTIIVTVSSATTTTIPTVTTTVTATVTGNALSQTNSVSSSTSSKTKASPSFELLTTLIGLIALLGFYQRRRILKK